MNKYAYSYLILSDMKKHTFSQHIYVKKHADSPGNMYFSLQYTTRLRERETIKNALIRGGFSSAGVNLVDARPLLQFLTFNCRQIRISHYLRLA